MPEDEPYIAYSLRDVLGRLETKLDQLVAAIGLKADRSEVVELDRRVGRTESRLTELEYHRKTETKQEEQRIEHRRWLIPTIAAVVAAAGAFGGALLLLHP